ncbi:hypothetical protein B9T31_15370, partial [Acinetobacter sp. ANC 4558]|uniref:hypothetical protein n=1 Tax=Acinetobacter sp. ANC 4558 TaxID=1977876 RepID=UPI000B7693BD
VGATSLGKVEITKVGQAIAHIPEFKAYYDAEYYTPNAKEILNMAKGTMSELPNGFISIVNEKGQKALERIYAGNSVFYPGDFDIDPNNFTFFVVLDHYFEASPSAARHFRFIRKVMVDSLSSIHISIDNAGPNVRMRGNSEAGNNTILSANYGTLQNPAPKPSLFVISYSKGIAKIRVNGAQTTGAMITPLTGLKAGEWDWFRNMNGKIYAWGGLNIDLAAPENTEYLKQLESYYKSKFAIP